jgi:hypothetical protein
MLDAATGARQALKVAETITKSIEAHRRYVEQKSRELALRFPERTGELSLALEIRSGFWGGKIHFPVPSVIQASVHSFPAFRAEDQALSKAGDEYVLDSGKLSKEIQSLLLRFEYRLEEPRFLDALIQRNGQLDPRSGNDKIDSYWLAAQLRHLSVLSAFFQKLEIRGLECSVDVAVHQEVEPNVPSGFIRAVERQAEFGISRDREKLLRLRREQLRDVKFAGKTEGFVERLREVFMPSRFSKHLDVLDPFHFWECQQGRQLFEIPYLQLPKAMTVISRTDLTLTDPAKSGKLIYRKAEIRNEIEEIFR